MNRRVICVDVETTGLGLNAAILEVAAIDVETAESLYFVPYVPRALMGSGSDPEALRINRYYERAVYRDMLNERETAVKYRELANMLDGNTFAGCNPTFDAGLLKWAPAAVSFLSGGANPIGEIWHHRLLDLSAYAAGVLALPLGELPGLAKVCELLGVKNDGEHSALGDARATAECFRQLGKAARNVRRLDLPTVRQWPSLGAVPRDVRVRSKGGCGWAYWQPGETDETGRVVTALGDWLWSSASGDTYDRTAPFTEVLEGQ